MKIGFLSYSMLLQRGGGLQNQLLNTIQHLQEIGVDAALVNPNVEPLANFDIVHLFGMGQGFALQVTLEARRQNVPIVLSPVQQAVSSRFQKYQLQFSDWLATHVSRYANKSVFGLNRQAYDISDHIIALSQKEKHAIMVLFGQDEGKISVVPNGVHGRFFLATKQAFQTAYPDIGDFILISGSISEYKNQLGVISATQGRPYSIVLAGEIISHAYAEKCFEVGGDRVLHLGNLSSDDPMLASVYASAKATLLASRGEGVPLCVLESLAAGTPAIVTQRNAMQLDEKKPYLQYIDDRSAQSIKSAIDVVMQGDPASEACQAIVEDYRWETVASQLKGTYRSILGRSE